MDQAQIKELSRRHRLREREWTAQENKRCFTELRPYLATEDLLTPFVIERPTTPIQPATPIQPTTPILQEIRDSVNQILDWTKEKGAPAKETAPAPPKPPDSYDLAAAAKFLGRSPRWLRDNCTSQGIGHERVGRGFRFSLHELERYLARHRRKGKKGVYEA